MTCERYRRDRAAELADLAPGTGVPAVNPTSFRRYMPQEAWAALDAFAVRR
jgi:hypothetical protein